MGSTNILITGANRGLGLELVKQLTNVKPTPQLIIAACRNPSSSSDLRSLAESCRSTRVEVLQLDVVDDASVDRAVEETERLCPDGLNTLINNAGIFPVKYEPEAFSFQSTTDCFRANAVAPLLIGKKFHPLLKRAAEKTRAGEIGMTIFSAGIVMMSSDLGSITNTTAPKDFPYYAYKASKAALNMVSKSLSVEFEKDGILVSAIHPGWVRTDMGGEQGHLSVEESVRHMIVTFPKMETGKFYNYDFGESGKYLPW